MNRSKLLTSTALISAAVFMTAGSANALSLKLGGFYEAWVGWAGNDKDHLGNASHAATFDSPQDFDVKTDSEIHFRAEETLDNGLKVGALIEMEAGVGNDGGSGPPNQGRTVATASFDTIFDEAFAWVKSKWGQVNVGNNDVASAYVGGVSTVGPVGITKSDIADWLPGEWALNNSDDDLGVGDAGNVTYFTPKVGGVQVIVSWTPDRSDWGQHEKDISEITGFQNAYSGAVKYGAKFGQVGLALAAGYTTLKNAKSSAISNKRLNGYNAKAGVDIGPFGLDFAFAHENLATRNDQYWAISGVWKINKSNTASVAYSDSHRRSHLTPGTTGFDHNNSQILTFGFSHNMGKGVKAEASAFWGKADGQTNLTDDNDGFGIVGGLKLGF